MPCSLEEFLQAPIHSPLVACPVLQVVKMVIQGHAELIALLLVVCCGCGTTLQLLRPTINKMIKAACRGQKALGFSNH